MFMTFEQIPPPEHPAARAARMIKELHEANIAKIDSGFVFYKKLENGDLQDVNAEMRAACVEQIKLCDAIIARPFDTPPSWEAGQLILDEVQSTVAKAVQEDKTLASIPEIGNYEHDKDA